MKKWIDCLLVTTLVITAAGCATAPRAPRSSAGTQIEIHTFVDRGDPATMNERQYRHRNEVGAWMERDLLTQLNRSGYIARQIHSREEFKPAPGRYLLEVRIDSYNPGSSAARVIVGYGVGAASLDNSYVLSEDGGQALLEWSDGVGTSQHWTRLPRALNQNTVRRITTHLQAIL